MNILKHNKKKNIIKIYKQKKKINKKKKENFNKY